MLQIRSAPHSQSTTQMDQQLATYREIHRKNAPFQVEEVACLKAALAFLAVKRRRMTDAAEDTRGDYGTKVIFDKTPRQPTDISPLLLQPIRHDPIPSLFRSAVHLCSSSLQKSSKKSSGRDCHYRSPFHPDQVYLSDAARGLCAYIASKLAPSSPWVNELFQCTDEEELHLSTLATCRVMHILCDAKPSLAVACISVIVHQLARLYHGGNYEEGEEKIIGAMECDWIAVNYLLLLEYILTAHMSVDIGRTFVHALRECNMAEVLFPISWSNIAEVAAYTMERRGCDYVGMSVQGKMMMQLELVELLKLL